MSAHAGKAEVPCFKPEHLDVQAQLLIHVLSTASILLLPLSWCYFTLLAALQMLHMTAACSRLQMRASLQAVQLQSFLLQLQVPREQSHWHRVRPGNAHAQASQPTCKHGPAHSGHISRSSFEFKGLVLCMQIASLEP